ncbi:putative transmembrane amino acid transporter protein [Cryptosporidium serpentis]
MNFTYNNHEILDRSNTQTFLQVTKWNTGPCDYRTIEYQGLLQPLINEELESPLTKMGNAKSILSSKSETNYSLSNIICKIGLNSRNKNNQGKDTFSYISGSADHYIPLPNHPAQYSRLPSDCHSTQYERGLKYGEINAQKTITQFGSFVYIVNSIIGAGLVAVPSVTVNSGILLSVLTNILLATVSSVCTLMLLRTMTMIANNNNFQRRYEYIATIKLFSHTNIGMLTEISFHITLQALNFLSIVLTSEALDRFITALFKRTIAFQIAPNFGLSLLDDSVLDSLYRGDGSNVVLAVTLGYIINAVVCIPMSLLNLEENMGIQYASFYIILLTVIQILGTGIYRIYMTLIGDVKWIEIMAKEMSIPTIPTPFGLKKYGQLFSTFIAAYSYVMLMPSWANEMKPNVEVEYVVWSSNIFCAILYAIFGYIIGFAYPNCNTSNNVFEILLNLPSTSTLTKACINIFNISTVAPGIMVNCITTRYNLLNGNYCSAYWAKFWGVFAPFAISWLFSSDYYFSGVLIWCSLVFSLICNFIAPALVYILACSTSEKSSINPTRANTIIQRYDFNKNQNKTNSMIHQLLNKTISTLKRWAIVKSHKEIQVFEPFNMKISRLKSCDLKFENNYRNESLLATLLNIQAKNCNSIKPICPSWYGSGFSQMDGEIWDPHASSAHTSISSENINDRKVSRLHEATQKYNLNYSDSQCIADQNTLTDLPVRISVFPSALERYNIEITYIILFFMILLCISTGFLNIIESFWNTVYNDIKSSKNA